jgi:hypothetical protein
MGLPVDGLCSVTFIELPTFLLPSQHPEFDTRFPPGRLSECSVGSWLPMSLDSRNVSDSRKDLYQPICGLYVSATQPQARGVTRSWCIDMNLPVMRWYETAMS